MLRRIFRCSLGIVLFLRIIHGSPISLGELNAQHCEDTVRQAKSAEMRKYFNESADPCEDFYEFTCGNYAKYHPTNTSVSDMGTMHSKINDKIRKEMLVDAPGDSEVDRKVKNYYRSCLRAPGQMSGFKDKIREIFKEFGQMPLLEGDNWQESDFDWSRALPKMIYKTGIQILFDIEVMPDHNDNSINRVIFVEPPFALSSKSLYVDAAVPDARDYYKASVALTLHTFLGVAEDVAEETAQEILDFEIALAQGMRDDKLGLALSELLSVKPIEEVQKKYLPFWDTKKLIGDAMGFTPNELRIQTQYLDNAVNVLKTTPKKAVANYIFYVYFTYFIFDISEDPGKVEYFCITSVKEFFYESLMNLIYRRDFSEQMKDGVLFMWQELKTAFEKVLQSPRLNWMQEDTRKYALKKLRAMKLEILSYEDVQFTQDFADLELNNRDFPQNLNAMWALRGKKARARFYEPAKPVVTKNSGGGYIVTTNTVELPIALLQPYYAWSTAYPYAYNFASLGFYIAHEIVHGFDDGGRRFDVKGNRLDWWDTQSESAFRNHTQCFVDQYKSYSYGGRPLPEMQEQGENIADNGGVRLAYAAYLNWQEKNVATSAQSFPGLSYTNRQLFFVSYSQLWCAVTHPDYMVSEAAGDIHAPHKFRVIGPLSNFPDFAKEFNCPTGSGMNPVKKCEVY